MSDPYVPTTERIKLAYRKWAFLTYTDKADEQFDRWLESLLATAGADTLREAANAIYGPSVKNWLMHRADSMEGKAHDQ